MNDKTVLFHIDTELWDRFTRKHGKNKLTRLRELIAMDVERE